MNLITQDLEGCVIYIDDIIIYSDDWATHVNQKRQLFKTLPKADLIINLRKSEIARAKVTCLGHEIGYGKVTPKDINIQAIINFPILQNRKAVRSFLGMTGYYRRFVRNFADIAKPLTDLLKNGSKFESGNGCMTSFSNLKAVITTCRSGTYKYFMSLGMIISFLMFCPVYKMEYAK